MPGQGLSAVLDGAEQGERSAHVRIFIRSAGVVTTAKHTQGSIRRNPACASSVPLACNTKLRVNGVPVCQQNGSKSREFQK